MWSIQGRGEPLPELLLIDAVSALRMRWIRGSAITNIPDEELMEDMLDEVEVERRKARGRAVALMLMELSELRVDEDGVEGLMSEGTAPAGGGDEERSRRRLERLGV